MIEDRRSGVVAYLAHCLLNQNTKVQGLVTESSLKVSRRVVELLRRLDVGLAQIPCPEFTYLGLMRPKKTKDQYDNRAYREHCKQMVRLILKEIEEYRRGEVAVACLLGIEGSPSCGVEWTTRGFEGASEEVRGMGILIEEIREALRRRGMEIPILGIPEKPKYGDLEKMLKEIEEAVQEAHGRRRKTYL